MRLTMILAICLGASLAFAQKVPRQPYLRQQTTDAQGRTVHYYLSEFAEEEPDEIPLVVYIQGSGWSSHFVQSEEGRIVGAMGTTRLPTSFVAKLA